MKGFFISRLTIKKRKKRKKYRKDSFFRVAKALFAKVVSALILPSKLANKCFLNTVPTAWQLD
jgi:hypothetical protein